MKLEFYKYHGTGNDFILVDNRSGSVKITNEQVALLCQRNTGIGADGLMLLENAEGYDFKMIYYNSDGNESSMCGNGGRCITAFAQQLGIVKSVANFIAVDGPHQATIFPDGIVSLNMKDVSGIQLLEDCAILNTGSPHYVAWVDDIANTDVYTLGSDIRYSEAFKPGGTNVNFVQKIDDVLLVRTYERGVEGETLSCGTGVTAAAIAASGTEIGAFSTLVETPGGELEVSFVKDTEVTAKEVVLMGPAVFVFKGEVEI